jgi:hypothetical protein
VSRAELEAPAELLYLAYKNCANDAGERPLTGTAFGRRMKELGFSKRKKNTGAFYKGIGIRAAR